MTAQTTRRVMLALCVLHGNAGAQAQPGGANARGDTVELLRDARAWSGLAGGAQRLSIAPRGAHGPSDLAQERFVFDSGDGRSFVLYGQVGLAASGDAVVGVGYEIGSAAGDGSPEGVDALVAVSRIDGSLLWDNSVPIALLDSLSTPSISPDGRWVVHASGTSMSAFAMSDGTPMWSADLGRLIVNASPTITDDRPGRTRVFITDYSFGASGEGRLYCINADAFDEARNPYQPGDIVWSVSLGGDTAGNTAAYRDGRVYVSTATGGSGFDQGTIRCYDADATTTPTELWTYELGHPSAFFSGVALRGDALYASSYAFTGDQYAARTVRLDRASGQEQWSVATNRTNMIPVALGDGRVLVSGGVPVGASGPYFGTIPSLQLIAEDGSGGAAIAWDSAMETLDDLNGNGRWDAGESFLSLGGWTIQPIVLRVAGGWYAFVSRSPTPDGVDTYFGASPGFGLVDLDRAPGEAGFVVSWFEGAGGSPALVGDELYAVGDAGLFGFGMPAVPSSGIIARLRSGMMPDVNGDGRSDAIDAAELLAKTGGGR